MHNTNNIEIKEIIKFFVLFLSIHIFVSCGGSQSDDVINQRTTLGTAVYQLSIQGKWDNNNPNDAPAFPAGGHFTEFVVITHNKNQVFWKTGSLASQGMERLAEGGATAPLLAEANAVSADVLNAFTTNGFDGDATLNGSQQVNFSSQFPLLTTASMLGPSPDWFVGIHDISMQNAQGLWYSSVKCRLFGYDAGTENGNTFILNNPETNPKANILRLEDEPNLNASHDITDDFAILTMTLVSMNTTETSTGDMQTCP